MIVLARVDLLLTYGAAPSKDNTITSYKALQTLLSKGALKYEDVRISLFLSACEEEKLATMRKMLEHKQVTPDLVGLELPMLALRGKEQALRTLLDPKYKGLIQSFGLETALSQARERANFRLL